MLFLVFIIAAFSAAISEELLGVTYNFDVNYFNTFSEKQCLNATQWNLVSYERLEIVPPYEGSSLAIRSLKNSCTTSFPIVFLNGTLELTVKLWTVSKYSGITITVFDENGEAMVSVRYQRSKRNFVPGWAVVSLPIKRHTAGYVQLSGKCLDTELVIVDSLRYIPDGSTHIQNEEQYQTVNRNKVTNRPTTSAPKETNEIDKLHFVFDESGSSSEDNLTEEEGSGEVDTDPSVTEDPNSTEDPGTDTDNNTEEPSPEEDTNNPEDGFWNAFTITIVSVGAFTVVGLIGVGSYFIGKNRGISQNPPIDWETLEAPSEITVPRARSVFSDLTYDRFS